VRIQVKSSTKIMNLQVGVIMPILVKVEPGSEDNEFLISTVAQRIAKKENSI
jgi:hypothetical protein